MSATILLEAESIKMPINLTHSLKRRWLGLSVRELVEKSVRRTEGHTEQRDMQILFREKIFIRKTKYIGFEKEQNWMQYFLLMFTNTFAG